MKFSITYYFRDNTTKQFDVKCHNIREAIRRSDEIELLEEFDKSTIKRIETERI